jgi:short-subunit dehydrogenase
MPRALITGASSGLGEQFAYQLAQQRYDLVIIARRAERLNAVAARARELGAAEVEAIVADLARREGPREIFEQLTAKNLNIDYLVNNAGFGTSGRFAELPLERELEEIDLNVTALVALTRLLLPAMIGRHSGTIINVASTAAFQGVPFMSTYAATKAFVLHFTEALAGELVGSGLRVMALCPGPVRTEFQSVAKNEHATMPSMLWEPAEKVVADAIMAAASGRRVYIAGILNFLTAQSTRLAPRGFINFMARRIYRPNT